MLLERQRLAVWTLKCIGYDHGFQLELCEKYPRWAPPANPPANQRRRKKDQKVTKGKNPKQTKVKTKFEKEESMTPSSSRSKKRKRVKTPDSEMDGETDSYEAKKWKITDDFIEILVDDSEDEVLYNIRSRGTKSRPIKL